MTSGLLRSESQIMESTALMERNSSTVPKIVSESAVLVVKGKTFTASEVPDGRSEEGTRRKHLRRDDRYPSQGGEFSRGHDRLPDEEGRGCRQASGRIQSLRTGAQGTEENVSGQAMIV